jgi:glucokinase
MQVLCGDIGGTKTRIALIDVSPSGIEVQREENFRSADYGSLQTIVHEFLAGIPAVETPKCGGFGIAGPVRNGRCETTNLPWLVDSRELEKSLELPEVHLTNDLEATAWGISALQASDFYELYSGDPDPSGNMSIIAAGTGLGEAGMCRVGDSLKPFSSEGGHSDFAPESELEFALLQFLSQRYGHVSWERVVSGMGIADIYRFLCDLEQLDPPLWLQETLSQGDAAAAISQAAENGRCSLCAKTMDLFVHLYGREAGNHALKLLATGGVYLGGGIAPKILTRLRQSAFLDAFFAKGRMEPLMRSMPVRVILNDRAALYGAALAAAMK